MYKVDVPLDYKEAAAIERRRLQEEQRKSRIFNAKERQIGLDIHVLEKQIEDKKRIELAEKMREEAFASDAIRNDKIAQLMDKRTEEDRKRFNHSLNDFRQHNQSASTRREFDLYDPEGLKKELPARISDNDPRCTLSGMQKFEGEDLAQEMRKKQQNEQMKNWTEQQARERKQAEENQKMADHMYGLKMIEMDQRAMELQKMEEDCRKAITEATTRFNEAQLREQTIRNEYRQRQEEEDKRTEIANNLYGDFLSENPSAAQSAFGGHRVVPDRWKGMTPEQLAEIRRQQEIQKKEAERLREAEKRLEEEMDNQRINQAKMAALMERDMEKKRREAAKQLAEENLRMAREQKNRQDYLNKDVYTNQPTAAYFMQFNTSTR